MLKGDWLRHPAIGVATFALIGLGFVVLNPYQGESGGPDDSAQQQLSGAQDRIASPESPIPDPTPDRKEWREEQDLQAQRDMARWAYVMILVSGAGVIVTAFGVVYVALTLKETRAAVEATNRATNETRKIGYAQTRAYLSIRAARILNDEFSSFEFDVENTGQSPARFPRISVTADVEIQKWLRSGAKMPEKYASEALHHIGSRSVQTVDLGNFSYPDELYTHERGVSVELIVELAWQDVFDLSCREQFIFCAPEVWVGDFVREEETDENGGVKKRVFQAVEMHPLSLRQYYAGLDTQ